METGAEDTSLKKTKDSKCEEGEQVLIITSCHRNMYTNLLILFLAYVQEEKKSWKLQRLARVWCKKEFTVTMCENVTMSKFYRKQDGDFSNTKQ